MRRVVRAVEVATDPMTGDVLLLACLAEVVTDDSTVLLDDVDVLGVRSFAPAAADAGAVPFEVEDRRGILPVALVWDVVEVFEMVETGLPVLVDEALFRF